MTIIKVTVKAERERFMESNLVSYEDHYVNTTDPNEAIKYISDNYTNGGWKILSINTEEVWLHNLDQ